MTYQLNDGWSFLKAQYDSSYDQIKPEDARPVHLPHDMLIGSPDHLYDSVDGWYFHTFPVKPEMQGNTVLLCFDGVYMDAEILLDGRVISVHRNGYTSFSVDLTGYLSSSLHQIAVHVRHKSPNSRWYSGAGIYRDVKLMILPPFHLIPDGIRIRTAEKEGQWSLDVEAEAESSMEFQTLSEHAESAAELQIFLEQKESCTDCHAFPKQLESDNDWHVFTEQAEGHKEKESIPAAQACLIGTDGECLARLPMTFVPGKKISGSDNLSGHFCCSLSAPGIHPWSIEDPVLYTLRIELLGDPIINPDTAEYPNEEGEAEKTPVQMLSLKVGLRETEFTPDQGFFLNGKHLKLRGVCLHHDLGALGSAFHEKAAERQLRLMKTMGANAIRTSHNPPASRFLDLCDRLGLLVIDELYDMWELPKTEYDNARFFSMTWQEDVASWIRRDRCHPCVILWSIGNEIPDMHVSERGLFWTKKLMEEVRRHDSWQAPVTFGSNYMPWAGGQSCADVVKIPGYNYAEKYYEEHHTLHPDWIIYGSETGSMVQSRGIYHFPMQENILSDEDLQCSALLNSKTSWGTQDPVKMLCDDQNSPFTLGQFIWSGIDYIGEPTPYHTKNSYFGQADTACFPKDSYYLYQAMWTEKPMIHIGVIWDWNEGQLIDIPVMTNGASAELLLTGRSLGKKPVDRTDPGRFLNIWSVPYEPGILEAMAYDEKGNVICSDRRSSFKDPRKLLLTIPDLIASRDDPVKNTAPVPALIAGRNDLAFLMVQVLDEDENLVENAIDRVQILVSGSGRLAGTDNGDSTEADSYQDFCIEEIEGKVFHCSSRKLFSGKLLLIIEAGEQEGLIHVEVSSPYLEKASLDLPVISGKQAPLTQKFHRFECEEEPAQHIFTSSDSSESDEYRFVDIDSEVREAVDMSPAVQPAVHITPVEGQTDKRAAAEQSVDAESVARQSVDIRLAAGQTADLRPVAGHADDITLETGQVADIRTATGQSGKIIAASKQEVKSAYANIYFASIKPEVRRIDLHALSSRHLTPENPSVSFSVRLLPEDTPEQKISFRVLNAKGVDAPGFEICASGDPYQEPQTECRQAITNNISDLRNCPVYKNSAQNITVTASANGSVYLRASVSNGADHPVILSTIELYAEGFAPTRLDPYHFISAALHDEEEGEITPGNDHGAAFSRDGFSAIGFRGIDFGPEGSDKLTLPVFNLDNDPALIRLWENAPHKGGELIAELTYHKPSIWNCYQEESWTLPRPLRGVHNLWFSLEKKIHLKGFLFEKQSAAFRYHFAADADRIYGDSFRKEGRSVLEIGNNVTLIFEGIRFDRAGKLLIRIDGATPLETQAVTVRIHSEDGTEMVSMCNFPQTSESQNQQTPENQEFPLSVPEGLCSISFVFLPGSCFDFHGFQLMDKMISGE